MEGQRVRAPQCPNALCSDRQELTGHGGYCQTCKTAWLRCMCGAGVNPLWRHCPHCGSATEGLDPVTGTLQASDSRVPVVELRIDESVGTAPINHGGYIWWLTSLGNLYRVSPANKVDPVEVMGADFAGASFALLPANAQSSTTSTYKSKAPKPSHTIPNLQRPLFAIAGQRHLALLDPAAADDKSSSRTLRFELGQGLRRPLDTNSFLTIASNDRRIALIALAEDHRTVLAICTLDESLGSGWSSFPLPELPVAGPLSFGNTFALFNQEALFVHDGVQFARHRFPDGFVGLAEQKPTSRIELPWGRSPFFSTINGLLIPGELHGSRHQEPAAAYVFASMEEGSAPRFSILQIPQGSMPSEVNGTSVGFAASGLLGELSKSSVTIPVRDSHIISMPSAATPRVRAAYCAMPQRALEIRSFPGNRRHFPNDYPDVQPVGLHICHTSLVATGLRDGGFPVMQAWSLA